MAAEKPAPTRKNTERPIRTGVSPGSRKSSPKATTAKTIMGGYAPIISVGTGSGTTWTVTGYDELSVTLEAVRRAGQLDTLEDVLVQEYRVSCASARSHDFVEGIRAQLVDKDRNPTWSPASLSAVTAADVENYFTPADPDLTF